MNEGMGSARLPILLAVVAVPASLLGGCGDPDETPYRDAGQEDVGTGDSSPGDAHVDADADADAEADAEVEPPPPPTGLTLTGGDEELTAEWEAAAGATSYEVYYATTDDSAGATLLTGEGDESDTTAVITGLVNGAFYFVWVKAVNAGGSSDFSARGRVRVGVRSVSVGSETFTIVFVPGTTFPTGQHNDGEATVSAPYWIATTEVTYGLWHEVHSWAAGNGYTFANPGTEGHDGAPGEAPTDAAREPVTGVDWRDVMVWTNALTELASSEGGSPLTCVYHDGGTPIRDATDLPLCDGATADHGARGFRLLTGDEWELAARLIHDWNGDGDLLDDGEHYPGNYLSGSDTDTTILDPSVDLDGDGDLDYDHTVAVFNATSDGATAEVGTRNPSAIGLYDVSGNVFEWCFTAQEPDLVQTMFRGGSWAEAPIPVYYSQFAYRDYHAGTVGLRIAISD